MRTDADGEASWKVECLGLWIVVWLSWSRLGGLELLGQGEAAALALHGDSAVVDDGGSAGVNGSAVEG